MSPFRLLLIMGLVIVGLKLNPAIYYVDGENQDASDASNGAKSLSPL